MPADRAHMSDIVAASSGYHRPTSDGAGIRGYGVAELFGPDGVLKQRVEFHNLVTTAGDQYYAKKALVGIGNYSGGTPTAANGMKLGTGTTAVAKSGAGAAVVSYVSGSNVVFDATYPQAASNGGDTGWSATYKTTWPAGTPAGTTNGITEVVIVNDQATNSGSSAANTYSRALLTLINKGASDTLAITWSASFLGA